MKLLHLISVCSDLGDTALEEATKLFSEDDRRRCFLIVGTKQAEAARRLQHTIPLDRIFVNPEWVYEWAVTTIYGGTFSEGVHV